MEQSPNNTPDTPLPEPERCADCSVEFGIFTWRHWCPPVSRGGCGKCVCHACLSYALVTAADFAADTEKGGLAAPISILCKSCFQRESSLDFSSTVTILGPPAGDAPSVLFLHGGGGCRLMFQHHAQVLAEERGFRCVLMDLPGHGSRMDEVLTMTSALDAITSELGMLRTVREGEDFFCDSHFRFFSMIFILRKLIIFLISSRVCVCVMCLQVCWRRTHCHMPE